MFSKHLATMRAAFEEKVQPNFRGYISELDGLRAGGLMMVLMAHFWTEGMSYTGFQLWNMGWIAMDSFFVMSGLLITGILLDAREKPNYYKVYYIRRALRIFPLYYAVLGIWMFIILRTNWGNDYRYMVQHWGSPLWFFLYVGNIRDSIMNAWPRPYGFGPLWSLQVEEQYYLLFPFAVALLSRKHLRNILIATICLSPILRYAAFLWKPENPFLQYVLLPCRCEGLALGALIAIRLRSGPWKISKLWLTVGTAALMGVACAGSVMSTWGTRNPANATDWDRTIGYSISSAGCACLVLWLICFRDSGYTRWLRIAPIRYLGKISYGVYLLHPLALWIIQEGIRKRILHFHKDDPLYVLELVALSLAMASISWHLFEGPILKLKDRFTYSKNRRSLARVEENADPSSGSKADVLIGV